jgi:CBS domain containing-hemolysin-like protein
MWPWAYVVAMGVLVFAGASFFFALAESSLFALGPWRARQLAQQPQGAKVVRLLEKPSELLATIVLGNTVANAAIVALVLWPVLLGLWPVAGTLIAVSFFILVGCEILPKTLAVRAPDRWAARVSGPMLVVRETTGWLQRLFERFNAWLVRSLVPGAIKPLALSPDDEYRELLELAFHQGALGASEKEIILQIISLDRRTAKEVMKPRSRMATISDDLSIEEMVTAARKFRHRRLPVYDEDLDTIVGVLNTRALLLDPNLVLEDAMEFPSFVPETMNLLQLLKSLQQQQRGMAIVLDEYGGTAGLVTMEDILEEVVGRIHPEGQTGGFVCERLAAGRWRVSGTMSLDDFRREYPELGDVPEVTTMGGLLVSRLEVVPAPGESVAFRGLRLTAQVVDDRRVKELLVEAVRKR